LALTLSDEAQKVAKQVQKVIGRITKLSDQAHAELKANNENNNKKENNEKHT
jgi:hypothetical protein